MDVLKLFLLSFIASVTALSEICDTPIGLHERRNELNGLQLAHLTSYCTIEHIIDLYNRLSKKLPQSLNHTANCTNFDTVEDSSLWLILTCVIQDILQQGDGHEVSPQIIRDRIANSALNYVQYLKDQQCTKQYLENMSFEEAVESFYGNDVCMEGAILRKLTESDNNQQISLPFLEVRENIAD